MESKNHVQLIGRLGGEPVVRDTKNGKFARFSIAINEQINENGQIKTSTQWHYVVAWRKLAEKVESMCHKGNEIAENASVSANSTIAALNLLNLVRNAEFEKFYLPTSNTQVKKFGAVFIISLKANLIGYGNAKVLVAATEYRGALYYSVTVPP